MADRIFVRRLSASISFPKNPTNEIVIDMTTGKIDPIATRDRIVALGLSEEYFDYSHKTKLITEKPVNDTIEDIVNNFLGKESKSTNEMFKKYETLEAFGDYRTIEKLVPKEFKNKPYLYFFGKNFRLRQSEQKPSAARN